MGNHYFKTEVGTTDPLTVVAEDDKKLVVNPVEVDWNYADTASNNIESLNSNHSEFLTINSPEFNFLKWLLLGTLQKIPKRLDIKKYSFVLHLAQLILVLAAIIHYFYVVGVFGSNILAQEEMELTLTTFKNIVWNFRNPVFTILGFLYLRKPHLDDMLCSLRLSPGCLQSAKIRIRLCCVLEIAFTVVLPAFSKLAQMLLLQTDTEKKTYSTSIATMYTVFLVLGRLLALPIVVSFITVFYLLYCNVTQYKRKIQTWIVKRRVKCEARNFFIDLQTQNKKAEKAFQPFMIIHIGILMLIFVPGVLCYVERFRSEGTYTKTYYTDQPDELSDPVGNVVGLEGLTKMDLKSDVTNNFTNKHSGPLILVVNMLQPKNQTTKNRRRQQAISKKHKTEVPDKKAQERILLEALTFLCELLALYVPFILLGKINKILFQIPHTIRSLKFDEQCENEYLVQNRGILKEMLEDFEPAEGLKILGMKLTVVKTVLVALIAPLLTLLFHILVRHVDISS